MPVSFVFALPSGWRSIDRDGVEMDASRPTKEHRKSQAGPKAEKKERASKRKRGLPEVPDRHNWKAFNPANIGRTKRQVQRNVDRAHQKQYVPRVDRTEKAAPPPPLVAVVGPRGVGKSTLVRSLIKLHARQKLADVRGPITLVTGKDKRITLVECPSDDVCAMCDVAKVADLVLLLVDARRGRSSVFNTPTQAGRVGGGRRWSHRRMSRRPPACADVTPPHPPVMFAVYSVKLCASRRQLRL